MQATNNTPNNTTDNRKPIIITEQYASLADYEEAHGSIDDLNELICTNMPAGAEMWTICPWLPQDEQDALINARTNGQDMEEAMLSLFGRDITCYEIVGGHTGREEDTIHYYCAH